MKIWIVGKNGILSKSFTKILLEKKIPFLSTSSKEVDITDAFSIESFLKNQSFTHVINCSAYTKVDEAEKNIFSAMQVNAYGVKNLTQMCKKYGLRLVHFSTDYVFSGRSKFPYKEEDRRSPLNLYGKSKLEGEKFLFRILKNSCLIRTSWLFGEGKNFISTMISLMKEREEIFVVDDQVGRPTFADDLAKTALLLLNEEGIFHFANDETLSWYEYAKKIFSTAMLYQMELKCKKIIPIKSWDFPTLAKRPKYSVLDVKKVENLLKSKVPSFEEALKLYFEKNYGAKT